ncbi:hypothetical protein MJ579_10625 [Klebsiella pneumoniae]|nr:hypothetical protein MJ579_10625 [Klebsiella pneumoniae]
MTCGSSGLPLYRRSGDAGLPGTDAMWQLVGFYLGWAAGKGRAWALASEIYRSGSADREKVTYRIHFQAHCNRRLIMGLADGEVLVDDRLIYERS